MFLNSNLKKHLFFDILSFIKSFNCCHVINYLKFLKTRTFNRIVFTH